MVVLLVLLSVALVASVGQIRYYTKEVDRLKYELTCTNGLWATDLRSLIKDHPRKDLFFRIGYPEEKL